MTLVEDGQYDETPADGTSFILCEQGSQVNLFQMIAEVFSVVVCCVTCEMTDLRDQWASINCCFKLGKTAAETYKMLKQVFGNVALGQSSFIVIIKIDRSFP